MVKCKEDIESPGQGERASKQTFETLLGSRACVIPLEILYLVTRLGAWGTIAKFDVRKSNAENETVPELR
jgi:hypothetical protein